MSDHQHSDDSHEDHGIAVYIWVFIALCLLTSASFFTTSSLNPLSEHASWAFMMTISCVKALLVILFFMHLKWEANWKWVLTIPASLMSLFLMFMLVPDVGMRQDNGYASYSRERLLYSAEEELPVEDHAHDDDEHDHDSHEGHEHN